MHDRLRPHHRPSLPEPSPWISDTRQERVASRSEVVPATTQARVPEATTSIDPSPTPWAGFRFDKISILPPGSLPPTDSCPAQIQRQTHVFIQPRQPTWPAERLPMEQPDAHLDLGGRIRRAVGGGRPLGPEVQRTLEAGLGADLSAVRVHTDGEADHLSRAVDAIAFTTGPDIFFRTGSYDPGSAEGLHLLAHEASHTVQQAAGPVSGTPLADGISVSDPADRFEQAAEEAAHQVLCGDRQAIQRQAARRAEQYPLVIQRVKAGGATWKAGVAVLKHLQQLVSNAQSGGNPQMTRDYPRFQDELAQEMAWNPGAKPGYEGTNVGAIAVMERGEGEYLATAFNTTGRAERGRAATVMGYLPDEVAEGYKVVTKSEGRKRDTFEHAELKLASSEELPTGAYIGISKECCLCCAAALLVQGKYRFGSCHYQAFDNWPIPAFITSDPARLKRFLGATGWAFFQGLAGGTSGVPLAMLEEIAHQGDFLTYLQASWGYLQGAASMS